MSPRGLVMPVLDECEIAYWMNHIAQGLKYLRSKNIVHRDLKPRNFMLQKIVKNQASSSAYHNYILKLADLGFGKVLGNQELTGTYLGTPMYICPEILDGNMYTANVDLWSVGVILFEMITARRAGTGKIKPNTGWELLRNVAVNLRRLEKFDISQPCRDLVHALLQPSQQRMTFEEFFNHPFITYVEVLVAKHC